MLLYGGVIHKPIYHMYYTNDKHPASEKLFPRINSYLLKYIHFVDISELGESYNCSSKIHPIHKYIVERWQSLLILGRDVLIDVALLLWKGRPKLEEIY